MGEHGSIMGERKGPTPHTFSGKMVIPQPAMAVTRLVSWPQPLVTAATMVSEFLTRSELAPLALGEQTEQPEDLGRSSKSFCHFYKNILKRL